MWKIVIISGLALANASGAIAAEQAKSVPAPTPVSAQAPVSPPISVTPVTSEPQGKSINEKGISGPPPKKAPPRPKTNPGVKF